MLKEHNLAIYNTLSKTKEKFVPLHAPDVGLYVCGMTVYDYWHIGNARVFVFFDVVVRYLRWLGYNVTYVRNITDIDDKIIKRAAETQRDYLELTQFFTDVVHADEVTLGNLRPTFEPKVSENIAEIIAMIDILMRKEYAYLVDNGDVYFNINKFADYGKLAHQDIASLRSGARVEVSTIKQDPLDFVLWKAAKPGEPAWVSPWGAGRPGWHIECSAMAAKYLGNHFDMHGGGADLQFPHHQNEVAQSEAACDCKFVNYWLHVGFVQVDAAKMSKSLGNFFTVREVLQKYHPEVVRFFMLASHYRSPLNYTEDNLNAAKNALTRLYTALQDINVVECIDWSELRIKHADFYVQYIAPFLVAMDDDFNTPDAIARLFNLARLINSAKGSVERDAILPLYAAVMRHFGGIFGILQHDVAGFLQAGLSALNEEQILQLIEQRNSARKNKNWQEADKVRQELLVNGIVLEDTAGGTIWKTV